MCICASLPSRTWYSADKLIVVCRSERYAPFAVLQSRVHEIWARFFSSIDEGRSALRPLRLLRDLPLPARLRDRSRRSKPRAAYHDHRAELMVAATRA